MSERGRFYEEREGPKLQVRARLSVQIYAGISNLPVKEYTREVYISIPGISGNFNGAGARTRRALLLCRRCLLLLLLLPLWALSLLSRVPRVSCVYDKRNESMHGSFHIGNIRGIWSGVLGKMLCVGIREK